MNDLHANSAWVIRNQVGMYFCGFSDPRKGGLPVKWSIGLCDARLFGGNCRSQAEKYIQRILEKDICLGARVIQVAVACSAQQKGTHS